MKVLFQVSKIASILLASLIVILSLSNEANCQYKRNIIFEEFSEVWCGPCASIAPSIGKWLENHPEYNAIFYYSYFNDNGKKVMNAPADYKFRQTFYSVPFYPYARINAVNAPNKDYPGFPTDTSKINAMIDTMSKTTPVKLQLDFINNGKTGSVKVNIQSDINLDEKLLFVYIVEKHHTYEKQQNGQTEFHHIMRASLPDSAGKIFSIKAGQNLEYNFDYSISANINLDLYATAIVQDYKTKYIYQSESVFKANPSSNVETELFAENILIYPNPADDFITIQIKPTESLEPSNGYKVQVFNTLGIEVAQTPSSVINNNLSGNSAQPGASELLRIDVSQLPAGVYFVKIGERVEKFVKL